MSSRGPVCRGGGLIVAAWLALPGLASPAAEAAFPFPEAYRSLEVPQGGVGVALADFDEDQDLDLAVVSQAGRVLLFPGPPDGRFQADSLAVRRIDPDLADDGVVAVGAGDYDADGHADLFLAGQRTTALLYGDGRGGFSPAALFDMGFQDDTATLVDLNGDGLADLLSAGVLPRDLGVRLARSPRVFGGRVSYALPGLARALAVGDLDGDGAPDIVTVDGVSDSVRVFFNDGAGGFARRGVLSLGSNDRCYRLALGDLDGDGRLDLATGSSAGTWVALGNGQGAFSGGARVASESGRMRVDEVTDDGRADLLIGAADLLLLPGHGDGTFEAAEAWPLDYQGQFQVGRADGGAFVAAASEVGASILPLDIHGQPPALPAIPLGGLPERPRLVDLDGDGRLDLVGYVIRYSPGADLGTALLATALGRGDGGFAAAWTTEVDMAFPPDFEAGEFTGDGLIDLLVPSSDPERLLIYRNFGDGQLLPTTELMPGFTTNSLVGGDFNADGRQDVILLGDEGHTPLLMPGQAGGGFAAVVPLEGLSEARQLVVGDFTGEGRPDLLVRTRASSTWLLSAGRGDGTFEAARPTTLAATAEQILTPGELDGDGRLDVAVAGNGRIALFLNRGAAFFEPAASFELRGDGATLLVGDVDGDGRADLVASRYALPPALILNEGEGHFSQPRRVGLAARVFDTSLGDLNGDGRPDLVLADWRSRGWKIVLNQATAPPTSTSLVAEATEWTVRLTWAWPAEVSPNGYELYRWRADGSAGVRLGRATRRGEAPAEFTDRTLNVPGRYRYVLRTDPADGEIHVVAAVEVDVDPALGVLRIRGAAPNPARVAVTLELERGAAGADLLLLFDPRGRLVRHLAVSAPGPGRWSARWDLRDDAGGRVPSGVYFARPAGGDGAAARLVIAR